jgi:type IV secretory pathway VirB4 component
VIKVEYSIVQKISSDVDAAYDEKCRTGKPTYKKPGITYQHVSTAKPGSTETQKVIERLLKNSFYGTQATTPWTTTNPDLNRKVMEYTENDAKAVSAMYEELNKEKETKEMKKLIINHNAVIVLIGEEMKTVVKILDPDTKEERGPWNTKLAVVSAIAKSFEHTRDGKHSTCYKLYEMLNTIKKPTNATIDFVADEMYQKGKRLKNYKWYQEAIKVKRPAPGKSVVIVMEDK